MLKESLPLIKTPLPGPAGAALIRRRDESVPHVIKCSYPLVIKRGEGAMVEDADGNIFLDWIGGVGVMNIGYSHPEVTAAVREQSESYFHAMMNIMTHEGYVRLAEKLNSIVPVRGEKKKTMFANSGAEAVENAVKIARGATGRPNIIVFSNAFHGRTMMTMTMTAKKAYSHGMGPFPDGVYRCEFPYLYRAPARMDETEAIDYYIRKIEKVFEEASPAELTAAVVLEPVQGEGGFIPAPLAWVRALREICDRHGILLIADEIQTGFGRSGRMFVSSYWEEADCAPDILVMAKSIAAGLPLSGVTASADLFDRLRVGILGGTYGGNALACAAALKVIEIIERDGLCNRALAIAERCRKVFLEWMEKYETVGDVRGIGAMMGIEFVKDRISREPDGELAAEVVREACLRGLLIETAGSAGNVIRFLCPLTVLDGQLDRGLELFEEALVCCIERRGKG